MGLDPEAFWPGGNYEGSHYYLSKTSDSNSQEGNFSGAFKGNPAAVCLLEEDKDDQWLQAFAVGLKKLGTVEVQSLPFFNTVKVKVVDAHAISDVANKLGLNLRAVDSSTITVSFGETTTLEDVDKLFKAFALNKPAWTMSPGISGCA